MPVSSPPIPPEFFDFGDFIRNGLLGLGALSALVASFLAHRFVQRRSRQALKRDVLYRFVGTRYVLTSLPIRVRADGEPFVALNQVSVVFADDPEVRRALRTMFDDLHTPQKLVPNIVALIKKMAEAADVTVGEEWDDNFFARPFSPGSVTSE